MDEIDEGQPINHFLGHKTPLDVIIPPVYTFYIYISDFLYLILYLSVQ
jgi:hypothetical protein